MSVVTNVILAFNVTEEMYEYGDVDVYPNMKTINAWLTEKVYGDFGKDVDEVAGGKKHLETKLYTAAFNYLNLDEFVSFIRGLKWNEPDNVQILVKEQGDDKFRFV